MSARTPKNVPGPFYTAKDECMSCHAPEAEAGGLMAYDAQHRSCYFARQPRTPDEEYHAIRAVCASCVAAVRYDGSDAAVVARLAEAGLGGQVDGPVPRVALRRNTTVTFRLPDPAAAMETIEREIRALESKATSSRVQSWFTRKPRASTRLHAERRGDYWMIAGIERWQNLVHDKLVEAGASEVRWYTDASETGTASQWPI